MPISIKGFRITSSVNLDKALNEMSNWSEVQERGGFKLTTNFEDLRLGDHYLEGVLLKDSLRTGKSRTGVQRIVITESHPFRITEIHGKKYVIVSSSRKQAYNLASKILSPLQLVGELEDCIITNLESLGSDFRIVHLSGAEGLSKLVLVGHSVENTPLYRKLSKGARVTYVQFYDEGLGSTVGIGWDMSILIFSRVDLQAAFNYLEGLIAQLC